jgi:hypothetical protein
MKRLTGLLVLALLGAAGLFLAGGFARSDDKPGSKKETTASAAAQPGLPQPGKEHEILKQLEGTWEATVKMPGAPGQPAMESKGEETNKLRCGGLWLISDFKSAFAGQPFEGHGIYGYDSTKKKYTSVWVDSMETYILHSEGTLDTSGKILTLKGEGPDGKGKLTKWKMTDEFKDQDTRVFTMAMDGGADGKDIVALTITYKRKK